MISSTPLARRPLRDVCDWTKVHHDGHDSLAMVEYSGFRAKHDQLEAARESFEVIGADRILIDCTTDSGNAAIFMPSCCTDPFFFASLLFSSCELPPHLGDGRHTDAGISALRADELLR